MGTPADSRHPLFVAASDLLPPRTCEPTAVPSLFVISLPRSLSTLTYQVSRRALGLAEPVWTTDGEVLNSERFVLCDPGAAASRRFTRPAEAPAASSRIYAFLDLVAKPCGFAYKDVVQPFLAAAWLAKRGKALRVLRISRPLADVALALLRRGWLFPSLPGAARPGEGQEVALLRGLLAAEAALQAMSGVAIEYDSLIRDEETLRQALRRLYPEQSLRELSYINPEFRRRRAQSLEVRESRRHAELSEALAVIRAEASVPSGGEDRHPLLDSRLPAELAGEGQP